MAYGSHDGVGPDGSYRVGTGEGVPNRVPTDAEIADSVPAIAKVHNQVTSLLTDEARARCEV